MTDAENEDVIGWRWPFGWALGAKNLCDRPQFAGLVSDPKAKLYFGCDREMLVLLDRALWPYARTLTDYWNCSSGYIDMLNAYGTFGVLHKVHTYEQTILGEVGYLTEPVKLWMESHGILCTDIDGVLFERSMDEPPANWDGKNMALWHLLGGGRVALWFTDVTMAKAFKQR